MLKIFKKWYLKNKADSSTRIIEGLLILVIYQWLPWLIKHITSSVSLPVSKASLKIEEILRYQVTFSVFTLLGSIIISFIFINYSRKIYRFYKTKNNKLKIIEATYYTPKNSVDITSELNREVIDDKLKINLTNDIGGDPDKGTIKEGKIKYSYNGKESERNYKERELIDLP